MLKGLRKSSIISTTVPCYDDHLLEFSSPRRFLSNFRAPTSTPVGGGQRPASEGRTGVPWASSVAPAVAV